MPHLVDLVGGDLPLPVGTGASVGVAPSDVDVLIDRIPFWLAITLDNPYQRATAQFQRDQIDQQPEAGEQSLASWWTRAQMSFHGGAGLDYLDTISRPQPEDRVRFKASRNVNVWTPGIVTRLGATSVSRAGAAAERMWAEVASGGLLITARPGEVAVWNGASWTARNIGSAFPVRAFCTDGVAYYVATQDGVWTAPIAGTATATKLWNLTGGSLPMVLGWAKQRLVLGMGPSVYVLETGAPTLPAALTTHSVASWTWSAVTESPSGIAVAGYVGLQSAVYKFELQDITGVPVLQPGSPLIQMPQGERVLSALFYLGSMLILGTDRGVRVCQFSAFYGTVTMGPITTDALHPSPFTSVAGYDRYVWAGTVYNGESQLVRIDLSTPLDQNGHYAWASDLVFPTGAWQDAPTAITFFPSGLKAVGVTSQGCLFESADTDPSDSAYLQTARMRMGTVENKHWLYATLRGTYGVTAPIGVSLQGPADDTFVSVYVATSSDQRFSLSARDSEWIALRFDFAEGAELGSYQVQALPAGERQRLIQLPVSIANQEHTRSEIEVGYPGWALDRLQALEHLEKSGSQVTVSAPALFSEGVVGVIERLVFTQTVDPGDTDHGTGGTLLIQIRTTT